MLEGGFSHLGPLRSENVPEARHVFRIQVREDMFGAAQGKFKTSVESVYV